jgi:uncharacterized protein (DUF2267 family)
MSITGLEVFDTTAVSEHFARAALADIDPEPLVRAVFLVLSRKIAPGEVEKIVRVLPRELRDLWPSTQTRSSRGQAV